MAPDRTNVGREVLLSMWAKIAAGAIIGFIIGSYAAPGLTLWVTVGVLAGYGVDAWTRQRRSTGSDEDDDGGGGGSG